MGTCCVYDVCVVLLLCFVCGCWVLDFWLCAHPWHCCGMHTVPPHRGPSVVIRQVSFRGTTCATVGSRWPFVCWLCVMYVLCVCVGCVFFCVHTRWVCILPVCAIPVCAIGCGLCIRIW